MCIAASVRHALLDRGADYRIHAPVFAPVPLPPSFNKPASVAMKLLLPLALLCACFSASAQSAYPRKPISWRKSVLRVGFVRSRSTLTSALPALLRHRPHRSRACRIATWRCGMRGVLQSAAERRHDDAALWLFRQPRTRRRLERARGARPERSRLRISPCLCRRSAAAVDPRQPPGPS